MQDRVADVLAQRATLGRGTAPAIATSLLLHGGLTAFAIYSAMHAPLPRPVNMVSITLAPSSAPPAAPPRRAPAPAPVIEQPRVEPPKVEEPAPKIVEPAPLPPVQPPPKPPEKNTVPLSPFGRSTKKGSEAPAVTPPAPTPPVAPPAGATPAGPEIPTGGTGVTGIEGGDFPYTIYITAMQRKIGTNWFRPQSAATGTAVVIYFRVSRDGRVSDARVETSSGSSTFDRAALSAVQSSSPFNSLPYGYQGSYIGIHLTFK